MEIGTEAISTQVLCMEFSIRAEVDNFPEATNTGTVICVCMKSNTCLE